LLVLLLLLLIQEEALTESLVEKKCALLVTVGKDDAMETRIGWKAQPCS
jgi:hypothetical protein